MLPRETRPDASLKGANMPHELAHHACTYMWVRVVDVASLGSGTRNIPLLGRELAMNGKVRSKVTLHNLHQLIEMLKMTIVQDDGTGTRTD